MNEENVIVIRHKGAIEWLKKQGIDGRIVSHAHKEDVAGKIVYGVLPLHLAVHTKRLFSVEIPELPESKRGTELSTDDMNKYGAELVEYTVCRVVNNESLPCQK